MNKLHLFFFFSLLILVSCKQSEDPNPLIRRWYYYEMETVNIYNDGRPNESKKEPIDDTRMFMEFRNGGVLETYDGNGTYTIYEGKLEMRLNNNFTSYLYQFKEDMLVLTIPENKGAYSTQTIYRLKKL